MGKRKQVTKRRKPMSNQAKLILAMAIVFVIPVLYGLARYAQPAPAQPSAGAAAPFVEPGNGRPMLVDLGSNTCIPCRKMQPILADLTREYEGRITIQVIDVYEREDLAQRYRVYTIPTQIFFDANGNELYRHEGFYPKAEITAKFNDLGML